MESEARARRRTCAASSPYKAADTIRVATLLAIAASLPCAPRPRVGSPRNAINSWQSNLAETGIQPIALPPKLGPERVAIGSIAAGGGWRSSVPMPRAPFRSPGRGTTWPDKDRRTAPAQARAPSRPSFLRLSAIGCREGPILTTKPSPAQSWTGAITRRSVLITFPPSRLKRNSSSGGMGTDAPRAPSRAPIIAFPGSRAVTETFSASWTLSIVATNLL